MNPAGVRAQYEGWLEGRSPVALYVRWYIRHGGARDAARLFGAMGPGPFARVLDVGCATGFYLRWAFDHGHGRSLLAGIDLSPVMLREAAARLRAAEEAAVPVVLKEASATSLPFEDASFDALLCNGVIKYLDDEMFSAFLAEARRVLAPGGVLAVADFGRPVTVQARVMPPQRFGIPVGDLRTESDLCDALAACGLENVRGVPLKRARRIPLTYEGVVASRR